MRMNSGIEVSVKLFMLLQDTRPIALKASMPPRAHR